jgi:hypothetical protein
MCRWLYNNEGLCGDLVSVGSVGTSYSCVVGDVSPDCGIAGTNLGTTCPSPPPPLSSPPPFESAVDTSLPSESSSAQDAGGDDVTLPAVAAGGGAAVLILAVLMGTRLYRRAMRTKAASADPELHKPDTLVEVMPTAGELVDKEGHKDSAEDWGKGRAEVTNHAESANVEVTEKAEQPWIDARRTLRGTHQLEWSELQMTKSIGSGSYGQVFLGRWRADEVAIKVVTLENGHNSEASTAAFIHEVRTWLFLGSASRHATCSVGDTRSVGSMRYVYVGR